MAWNKCRQWGITRRMHYAELYCIVQYLGPVEFGNNLKEIIYSNRHQDKGFEYSPDTIFMFLSGRSIHWWLVLIPTDGCFPQPSLKNLLSSSVGDYKTHNGSRGEKKRGCEVFGFKWNLFITFILPLPRAQESLRKKSGVWKSRDACLSVFAGRDGGIQQMDSQHL